MVPAGSFIMGSAKSEEVRLSYWWTQRRQGPPHQVTIARAFALGRREVTYDEWNACRRDGGCTHWPSKSGRDPVTYVIWDQAKAYVRWLSRKTGQEYRLPSESEWVYAAGRENSLGLQGINGEVWEWVEDCWNDDYDGAPNDGAAWTAGDCARRVLRGGSWSFKPKTARASGSGYSNKVLGFGSNLSAVASAIHRTPSCRGSYSSRPSDAAETTAIVLLRLGACCGKKFACP